MIRIGFGKVNLWENEFAFFASGFSTEIMK
ncbi:hypothetical protein SAMN06265350_106220 [Solitalea koreensis]|uniref:Uncharacterized protein n=1 Tax=Solitalea koreensis TaxID=543615 RepID=A0A521DDR3_9SPHI|nr:hypothetical protein SAMN06265350_106220 [Solitalea koreensis]